MGIVLAEYDAVGIIRHKLADNQQLILCVIEGDQSENPMQFTRSPYGKFQRLTTVAVCRVSAMAALIANLPGRASVWT